MTTPNLLELRSRLSQNLKRRIGNAAVEAKELAAFDIIMSRRGFLKAVHFTALGTLVTSAFPPTAWGKHHKVLGVKPSEVCLTAQEIASISQAAGLTAGTELFQDTIYAQPVVSPTEPNSHDLIEAARSRMRVQSRLDTNSNLEEDFLDRGFHFGPAELIQIEQDESGHWELVHYFHTWAPRTDGARTDGLVRHVIMDASNGLSDPTRIFCITGSHTNEFSIGPDGLEVAAAYAIYVEQGNGLSDGFVVLGRSLAPVESGEVPEPAEYPIEWTHKPTSQLNLPPGTNRYLFADKYVNAGLDLAGAYAPTLATEHIVIYLTNVMKVISLDDATTPGMPNLIVTTVPYPSGMTNARFTHIQFEPTAPGPGDPPLQLADFALTAPEIFSDNKIQYVTYATEMTQATIRSGDYKTFGAGLLWLDVTYSSTGFVKTITTPAPIDDSRPDYSSLRNVNGLASAPVEGRVLVGATAHLKVGNFPGSGSANNRGLVLFAMVRERDPEDNRIKYLLAGDFPLAVPDDAGIGKITGISGGISKFGGLRLFAGDDNGNVFMLRQRRLPNSPTPYAPPIYIENDAEGDPATFPDDEFMEIPASTSPDSNLQDFDAWMSFFTQVGDPEFIVGYNMVLSGLLGFGTDDSNVAQATWLGNGYQAVYAPKRFGHDAEHVVIREVSDGQTSTTFNAFNVFNSVVEKTWHSRLIATQATPSTPNQQESGDHYHLTLSAVNVYGSTVALSEDVNPGMRIEVRGDAPMTVVDQTNNRFYDIDRYTSFIALPDPASNRLRIAVKAQNFAQLLYVRLLQTEEVSPTSSDLAMLGSADASMGATTEWMPINLAAEAQGRMAASEADAAPGGSAGTCADPTIYICAASLAKSNDENAWQTKGSYTPSNDNLASLAGYLNQSGQNLSDASAASASSLSVGAKSVDPLTTTTSLTADSGRPATTTTFDYSTGNIYIDDGVSSGGLLGGFLNHLLHDALHWLRNVEGDVYNSLPDGVKVEINEAASIAVTVSKDIMKQVNGVEEDLHQVVSTVEEYGSVILNVVATVVESSFFFRFIKLLIELISLFVHLEDIKKLHNSLISLMEGLSDPTSTIPLPTIDTDFPWGDNLQQFVGPSNQVTDQMGVAKIDEVADAIVNELIDLVLRNPFTNKLLEEAMSVLSRAISAAEEVSPLRFRLDESIVDTEIQLMEDIAGDVESLFEDVADDVVDFLINQVVADIEDPQQTFSNFASGLGQFMAEVETETMDTVYAALSEIVAKETTVINDLIGQFDLMELDIPLLADLFRLFGIGSVSGDTVKIGGGHVFGFPMALVIWTSIFMSTGRSTSDISELIPPTPTEGELGASANDLLTFANATVAAVFMTINGALWAYAKANEPPSDSNVTPKAQVPILGDIANLTRWLMSATTMSIQLETGQASVNWTKGYLPVCTYSRLVTGIVSLAIRIFGSNTIENGRYKKTEIVTLINLSVNLAAIVLSVTDAIAADKEGSHLSGADWAVLAGTDVGRAGVFGKMAYAILNSAGSTVAKDYLFWFSVYVIGTAAGGFGAAAIATGVDKFGAVAPTTNGKRPDGPKVIPNNKCL